MKVGSRRIVCGALGTAAAWLLSVAYVGGQAPQTGAPTAAQNQIMFTGQIVSDTNPRSQLNAIILDQRFGNPISGRQNAVCEITGIRNYSSNI